MFVFNHCRNAGSHELKSSLAQPQNKHITEILSFFFKGDILSPIDININLKLETITNNEYATGVLVEQPHITLQSISISKKAIIKAFAGTRRVRHSNGRGESL